MPSLLWRLANWVSCFLWVVTELWGFGLDAPAIAKLGTCTHEHLAGGSQFMAPMEVE